MIKLRHLVSEEVVKPWPNKSLDEYLLLNQLQSFSGYFYHGTPPEGLKDMLSNGIYGTQHGEIAEYDSFSTSINSEVLSLFSEMNGTTGLSFKLNDVKIIILDDILTYLVTRLPGSGMSVDVDEQQLEEYCERFNIPVGGYSRGPYLPYNYLTSLGVDAFVYEYVWNSLRGHRNLQHNDEAEIGFIGRGIEKLNRAIYTIYLDGNEYEPEEKQTVLQELEHYIEHD